MEETEKWLELSLCTPDKWIAIVGTRLETGASSWFHAEKAKIREIRHCDWADLTEFRQEITTAFSPIMEEEQDKKVLKALNQIGNVQNYMQRF